MRLITLASLLGGDLGCRACKSGPHEAEDAADAAAANPLAPKAAPVVDDNFGADLGSSVHGQVLSASGSPLEGLTVAIGDRTAVTDRNGAFVFENSQGAFGGCGLDTLSRGG